MADVTASATATDQGGGQVTAGPGRRWWRAATWRSSAAGSVLVPVVVALAFFLWRLGRPALWLDEAATVQESGRSLGSLLAFLSERDAGLGAYYLGMHVWTRVGDSEWWLRLPSALAMAAAVGLVADLARRWWGSASALGAGLILALSPMASRYAQEARPYAFAVAFAVLSTWLLWRAVTERRRWWIGYSAALAALGLTHLVALLVLLAHPAFLMAAWRRSGDVRTLQRWLLAGLAGLGLPVVLAVMVFAQRGTVSWIPTPELSDVGDAYVAMAGSVAYLAVLALLAAFGARLDSLTAALATWCVLPPAILAAVGLLTPAFLPRYLVVCGPALVLLAAGALRESARWRVLFVAAVALAVAWTPLVRMRAVDGHGGDIRSVANVIAADCRAGDAVQSNLSTVQTLPYYLRRSECDPSWVSGGLPPQVRRVWVVVPNWQRGRPSGVTGLAEVRTVAVPGLRVSLWRR
ncbi:glycosyltransferase family 39 protein [Actinopolymorpha alba]|uniref:glycosyltransferase family 39 protein n=1 Tax=Actinopolymorpha alba TaxID=533267 RepID=UPI00037229CB|nr:glycosyltransferase family 39 protein [Actinopolymorpha alba]